MFLETVSSGNGFLEVRITKDVLPENLQAFKDEMYALTEQGGIQLHLDFEKVERFCSWALGVLAVVARRLQEKGGELTISSLNSNLQRIFMYARLDRSIDVIKKARIAETMIRAAWAA